MLCRTRVCAMPSRNRCRGPERGCAKGGDRDSWTGEGRLQCAPGAADSFNTDENPYIRTASFNALQGAGDIQ